MKIINIVLLIILSNLSNNLYSQVIFNNKIDAADRQYGDQLGSSVDIYGDVAVVGASRNSFDSNVLDYMQFAGAAYIYKKDINGVWGQHQKLVASDRKPEDLFGNAVAIFGDFIIVGAPQHDYDSAGINMQNSAGAVYLFKLGNDGYWHEIKKIVQPDRHLGAGGDYFGWSLAMYDDYFIVGACYDGTDDNLMAGTGSVYIYKKNITNDWNYVQKVFASDRTGSDYFGYSVDIFENEVVIGAVIDNENQFGTNSLPYAGSAYIFKEDALGSWIQVQKLVPNDRQAEDQFGNSVSINNGIVVIGAPTEDEDLFGGNTMLTSGSAYIFNRQMDNTWLETQKIVAFDRSVDCHFGTSVNISNGVIVVGALTEKRDEFGIDVVDNAGAAYVFQMDYLGSYNHYQKIVAYDRSMGVWQYYGNAVVNQGSNILIGALSEGFDENSSNYLAGAGAAYFYDLNVVASTENEIFNDCIIYPNPSSSEIKVVNIYPESKLTIVDAIGRICLTLNISGDNETINVQNLGKGVYTLIINYNHVQTTKRFVKQ